jgi:hypothetical protein
MESLDDVSAELRRRAAQIEAAGEQLAAAAALAIWTSIGADAFRAQVADRRHNCVDLGASLRAAASVVGSYSDAVTEERRRLARLANIAGEVILPW